MKRTAQLKLGRCTSKTPLVKRDLWPYLPDWIALYAERGSMPKCWEGHRLCRESCRKRHPECTYCEAPAALQSPVLVCRQCSWWLVCSTCAKRPRLPKIRLDPLFFGPNTPRLLPSTTTPDHRATAGSIIICPGGNYQFLVPHEGPPVAEYFAQKGFRAYVLRYRLLPKYDFEDMQQDLEVAAQLLRQTFRGPVCALGFSAGGHLVASVGLRTSQATRPLEAQALVYPCIDGRDWADEDTCGFWGDDFDECFRKGQSLQSTRRALLGGRGFAAPPTFLVSSTKDRASPPKQHTDLYAAALRKKRIHCTYLRRNFGPHGFGMSGGWTQECLAWLHQQGFGPDAMQ